MRLRWKTDIFSGRMTALKLLSKVEKREKYLNRIIPDASSGSVPEGRLEHVELEVSFKDRDYQVELRRVSVEGFSEKEELLQIPEEKEFFIAVYMRDVTELNAYIRENEEQRMIAGLIYIDNYDEVMESVEEVRQSLLVALLTGKSTNISAMWTVLSRRWRRINILLLSVKRAIER